jgi:hypothetical protein
MEKKSFRHWKEYEVKQTFGVKQVKMADMPGFQDWLSAQHPVAVGVEMALDILRDTLEIKRRSWNETELRSHFIGPVTSLVKFIGEGYGDFADREIHAVVNDVELFGTVDWMVATGDDHPQIPFFFIHEYKKFTEPDSDPFGQLLAALVAAQALNHDGQPLYGCVVMGNIWYFVLLDGKKFAVSEGFDAAVPRELKIVWSILQETKIRIEQRVKNLISTQKN